ncbi:MAG: hypothetical protein CFE46_11205 [Burkholderiales bacterium PBB6]|nr:MAG: hypothetical protein CFE46_11205 [Burkholderiales bacterium PBB6]
MRLWSEVVRLLTVALSALAALGTSLLAAMYVVTLCNGFVAGATAAVFHILTVLISLACIGLALARLSSPWRLAGAVSLLAACVLVAPTNGCGGSSVEQLECQA